MCRLELCEAYGDAPMTLVGATPIGVSVSGDWDQIRAYADRVDAFVQSLNQDARNQIVFADPSKLADIAKDYGTGAPAAIAELQARAAKRGSSQTAKDLDWSAKWDAFRIPWASFYADVHSMSPGIPAVTAWAKVQTAEADLRTLSKSFASLGGTKLSKELPATLETGTGVPEPESAVPWGSIVAVGGAVAAAIALSSVAKIVRG